MGCVLRQPRRYAVTNTFKEVNLDSVYNLNNGWVITAFEETDAVPEAYEPGTATQTAATPSRSSLGAAYDSTSQEAGKDNTPGAKTKQHSRNCQFALLSYAMTPDCPKQKIPVHFLKMATYP
ncbi:MAG: hypothetical protein IPM37_12645 [Hahellaceae bacterium]|nr:hypothetical protein [Hahellaceae bacterium]